MIILLLLLSKMVPRLSQHKKRAALHAAYMRKLKKTKLKVNHIKNSLTVSPDSLSITNENKMKNMDDIVRTNTKHQTKKREDESLHKGTRRGIISIIVVKIMEIDSHTGIHLEI